ncbi:hypothetical protein Tco_0506357 [Tanacetum coccineum]
MRLLTLTVASRHSGKEKVTLDDLFLLHSMVGTQDEGAADAEDDEECVDATSNMSITNRLRAWMKDWVKKRRLISIN